ncbi:MAG: aldehyde dehydrogenase family protein [Phycisphaerales bacterium]
MSQRHLPTAANYIAGHAHPIPGGDLVVRDPAEPSRVVYSCSPNAAHVDQAVDAARRALPVWSGLPKERRFAVLHRYAAIAKAGIAEMAAVIADEVGKAMWECKAEAGILSGKVDITLDPAETGGLTRVTDFEMALSPTRTGRCVFKPHGVMAVIGPFNFPAHLPNGHIVPALAAGNTVVFKPSDKAPGAGQLLVEWFLRAIREELGDTPEAKACGGAVNLVQGGGDIAAKLCSHPGIDGVAFTGSWPVAKKIALANIDRPGRMLAFELGGSNPTVVMDDADMRLAALEVARSAFNTTGQRCTCTRRLIVHEAIERKFVALIGKIASNLIIGHPHSSPVFTGPIISRSALDSVLNFQAAAAKSGASVIMEATEVDSPTKGYFVSPSIIRVDRFTADPLDHAVRAGESIDPGADIEVFGPVLRYATVTSIEGAIQQANATRYGLAASIFTGNAESGERFIRECRAGCINVNTGTAGASSKLPFGGLGLSGNHRPAGSFAIDYCASPVACMVERSSTPPAVSEGMRFDDAWLA